MTRDGTAEPVSREQIFRRVRGQGNIHFLCSADHEQDWQPYPVDPYSAICDDHTYIHTAENEQADAGRDDRTRLGRINSQARTSIHFPCSADHEQGWHLYPGDPYAAICDDHTYIQTAESSPAQGQ